MMNIQKRKKVAKKAILFGLLYILVKWSIILGAGTFLYQADLWRWEFTLIFPIFMLSAVTIRKKLKNKKSNPV